MYKIIRQTDTLKRIISPTKSATNYITKNISPNISLATTKGIDCNEIETTLYDRIYFVLSGVLRLNFDNSIVEINPQDSCFVSKNTTYTISETFEAIVVNSPAFDPNIKL